MQHVLLEGAPGVVTSPLCVLGASGLAGMFADDRFATYDLSAACLVDTWGCTFYGVQFPLCIRSVGLAGMFVDDQFCHMQNAVIMAAFLCSDSSVTDGVMRPSMYAGLCV